jgi:hypothetical protein
MKIHRTALFWGIGVLVWAAAHTAAWSSERKKVIDFDDELVEGMNKRPLDSVSQLGEGSSKKKKPHLYRKRASFRSEMLESLKVGGLARSDR